MSGMTLSYHCHVLFLFLFPKSIKVRLCRICCLVYFTDDGTKYNYDDVLHKILFYAAQRSRKLPVDNPIPWRTDSALKDRGDNGEDLTGGWYDGLYFFVIFLAK